MAALQHLFAFVPAAALVIAMPGPATLIVAAQALTSTRSALRTLAGIVAGDIVLISLAALGMSALIAQWPGVLEGLRVAGAAYIATLGIGMLRPAAALATSEAPAGRQAGFTRGLGLTLCNPKPLLFFGAFFPLFIDLRAHGAHAAFATLGAIFEILNLAWFSLLIGAIARGRLRARALAPERLARIGGIALLACAALVLFA